jgi:hypothetical protein
MVLRGISFYGFEHLENSRSFLAPVGKPDRNFLYSHKEHMVYSPQKNTWK